MIGETGETTKPVRHLLSKIGFRYLETVDPFDGGPHYGAKTDQISLIRRMFRAEPSPTPLESNGNQAMVAFEGKRGFGCLLLPYQHDGDSVLLPQEAHSYLQQEEASQQRLAISPLY